MNEWMISILGWVSLEIGPEPTLHAGDLLKMCSQEKPVREWESRTD